MAKVAYEDLDRLREEAAARGEEMFMGIPDAWYENPVWLCVNGHVSRRTLKSERRGSVCLACGEPVRIAPPHTTED